MKFLSRIMLATVTVSVASFASAASISGSTDFRVTLPEILVLYHWDDAHLILTDVVSTPENDSNNENREISDTTTRDLTELLGAGPYTIGGNVVNTDEPTDISSLGESIEVTLKDSWGVRSLSTGNVTLTLDNSGDRETLKNVNNSASTILTESAVLISTGTGITGSNSTILTIPSGWNAVTGDIKFTLNLANANHSGEYNTLGSLGPAPDSAGDTDTFLLTLASIP